jgi:hypothetical protein
VKAYQNPDGTYNGLKILADLSGLSLAEIAWTWNRMKQLHAEGVPSEKRKAIVAEEAKSRPWEKKP